MFQHLIQPEGRTQPEHSTRSQQPLPGTLPAPAQHSCSPCPHAHPSSPPHRALTLGELIEAGGVAEGADGSCLPAAPALHAHRGAALAEAESCMAVGFRMREKDAQEKNVLIQQMSLGSRQPRVSRHADSRALWHRARQPHSPACTTACSSRQQPLINSICAGKRCAAPIKGETHRPRQLKGRIRHSHLKNSELWARRDAAQNPKGC